MAWTLPSVPPCQTVVPVVGFRLAKLPPPPEPATKTPVESTARSTTPYGRWCVNIGEGDPFAVESAAMWFWLAPLIVVKPPPT